MKRSQIPVVHETHPRNAAGLTGTPFSLSHFTFLLTTSWKQQIEHQQLKQPQPNRCRLKPDLTSEETLTWLGAVTPIHWEKSCCEDTHMLIPSIKCPDSYFNSQILEKPVGISNKNFTDVPNSASLNYFIFPII